MVESASKGAILLFAKEAIASSMLAAGVGPTLTGCVLFIYLSDWMYMQAYL
jgi:hypothetical protein